MEIIPVVNCNDFQCVKDKLLKINEFSVAEEINNPAKVHIDISDGIYATEPKWNDPESFKDFIFGNNLDFNISVHFMAAEPSVYIGKWLSLIAKAVIPVDSQEDARVLANFCRGENIVPSLSIPPTITAGKAIEYANDFNEFQILAVSPGPSGQKMADDTFEKIKFIRKMKPSAIIEVDGGVNPSVIPLLKNAGADIALSESYIFDSADPKSAYQELKSAL